MNIALKKSDKKQVLTAASMYEIMQKILLRENRIDRNREHLWTISLDTASHILAIELVSMGSVHSTIVEPMEVFSIPLQKRAVKIIVVHNHPSQQLVPSDADRDTTDQLLQCGLILNVPVLDHIIITEKSFYSFAEEGLLARLEQSTRYVPHYKLKEHLKKEITTEITAEAEQGKAIAMAVIMQQNGEPLEKIMQYTGLDEAMIQSLGKGK